MTDNSLMSTLPACLKRRDDGNGRQDNSIVEKGLETRRVVLGTVVPYCITVVNHRQDVWLEVKDQERSRKKPGKTPEEVHTTRHLGNNMVDVVSPSQSVILWGHQEAWNWRPVEFQNQTGGCGGVVHQLWLLGNGWAYAWSCQHWASTHCWSSSYWQGQDMIEVRRSEACSCCQQGRS